MFSKQIFCGNFTVLLSKSHLVVNLETKNRTSYLVKILQSKGICFVWWVSLEMGGTGH